MLCLDSPKPPLAEKPANQSWLGIVVAQNKLLVLRVLPDSPASLVGLQSGDEIISLHAVPVANAQDIKKVLADRQPKQSLIVKIKRSGKKMTASLTVGKKPKQVLFPQYHVRRWSGPINPSYDAIGTRGLNPVIFYFTASWCPPCQKIRSDVEKLYQDYKDKITFTAVALSDDFLPMVALQKAGHYSFTVMDDLDLSDALKIDTVPTFIIVTLSHDTTTRYQGVDTSNSETNTLKLIRKELDLILAYEPEDTTLL